MACAQRSGAVGDSADKRRDGRRGLGVGRAATSVRARAGERSARGTPDVAPAGHLRRKAAVWNRREARATTAEDMRCTATKV